MAAEHDMKTPVLLLCALLPVVWGCASQVAPSGGPQDTEPPQVVRSIPPAGTLRFEGSKIALEFSEYVDRRSFQESAFLSPSPGTLRYSWSGREVEISFSDTLRPNTTYILTVGTDLRDTRNNRLAASFTLPFSTGDKIDSCSAAGRVDDPSPGGVMVFAYDVADGRGDTLNPAAVKPDYLTQTGTDGRFTIRNMRPGVYRLMAVRDVFKNLIYNVQTDMYGMAAEDIRLEGGETAADGIGIRLASEDTLRPFVTGVRPRNRTSLLVRFNEAVEIPGGPAAVAIADTAHGRPLTVFVLARTDTGGREFVAVTSPQDSGAVYRLSVAGFTDAHGIAADSSGAMALFTAEAGPDTQPPAVTSTVSRDSMTSFPPLDTVRVTFSEPVDTGAFARGFALLGPDRSRVKGTLHWRGAMIAEFIPDNPYSPGAWYRLTMDADSIRDHAGNVSRDSLPGRRFRITEEKQLSSVSGDVVMREGNGGAGGGVHAVRAIVEAVKLPAGGGAFRRVSTDSAGAFVIDRLPEGLYLLSAFIDRNGNGVHDRGVPWPLKFAEPFGLYTDTLKLRPRWPVEGVRITIGR